MTWTYTGDPANSNLDAVRFLVGDTDTADEQLQDEEINWLLSENATNIYSAAIQAAETIAAKYAREMNKRVGQLWIDAAEKFKHYNMLATNLREQRRSIAPTASVHISNDTTRRMFQLGQFDVTEVGDQWESTD